MQPHDTIAFAAIDTLTITPPVDADWLIEAALSQPNTLAAPIGCSRECREDGGAAKEQGGVRADVGTYLTLAEADAKSSSGSASATSAAAGEGGETAAVLHSLAPPSRVAAFARCGLLYSKWRTLRKIHAETPDDARRSTILAIVRASAFAPPEKNTIPLESLYAKLGSQLAEGQEVHNEIVPIVAMHLDASLTGRCPCLAL